MKSLSDIIYQARQLMSQPFTVNHPFSPGFTFKANGRLAYELVLDASGSMEVSDYPPSRFAAAKQAAIGFLQKCAEQTPDALVGVVFYGSAATVASPLLPARSHQHQLLRAMEDGEIAAPPTFLLACSWLVMSSSPAALGSIRPSCCSPTAIRTVALTRLGRQCN